MGTALAWKFTKNKRNYLRSLRAHDHFGLLTRVISNKVNETRSNPLATDLFSMSEGLLRGSEPVLFTTGGVTWYNVCSLRVFTRLHLLRVRWRPALSILILIIKL